MTRVVRNPCDAVRKLYEAALGRPIGLDIDECGLGKNVTDDAAEKVLPGAYALLANYRASNAYFIATNAYDSKGVTVQPHTLYYWFLDNKAEKRNEAAIKLFAAATAPVLPGRFCFT